VASAGVIGDIIVCSAYAHEMPDYGLNVGLKNYPAAYCVGLLCARRCLDKFGLDKVYLGNLKVSGNDFTVESANGGPSPFSVVLDTGLNRTSTGAKIFAALKGALDGGLDIPHNEKRFVGYESITKKYDPELMRKYIFGGHIADYMDELIEEEPDSFRRLFSKYIKHQVKPDDLDGIYKMVHKKIRKEALKNKNK
jgi:large subunit ribosomal protein L5e